jgi:hypothetical protein
MGMRMAGIAVRARAITIGVVRLHAAAMQKPLAGTSEISEIRGIRRVLIFMIAQKSRQNPHRKVNCP